MYDQLTSDMTATQYRDFSLTLNVAEGVVGKMYGFHFFGQPFNGVEIHKRGPFPVVKDPDAVDADTDNGARAVLGKKTALSVPWVNMRCLKMKVTQPFTVMCTAPYYVPVAESAGMMVMA